MVLPLEDPELPETEIIFFISIKMAEKEIIRISIKIAPRRRSLKRKKSFEFQY